ncbi:dTMP kinase [Halarsenatibacter silvermanii]|uniref:Thymidylate kinase n=1 Tax=Halarsenatibacter silvermanii TaxID=321763 RepID=A0A1G9QZ15_9FIRM|nr:dTMP kinase [Halarsenatibacter silvermanii]SDM16214.1 dTMP kinase [Halarsenatibacter silvermanii]
MTGVFITLEGIEGSGKTTQVEKLGDYFKQKGREVKISREPGATPIGESIRDLLLNPGLDSMNRRTEILLYAADRAEHQQKVIAPALEQGKIVISDRYYDSSLAYQGFGRRIDLDMIKKINRWAVRDLKPDLTFLLDLEAEIGLSRARSLAADDLGDRLEREEISFHRRVRQGYLQLACDSDRFVVIKADRDAEDIQKELRKKIEERLL